jgi:O-antigen/teichoic acid export membrane protein
MTTPPSGPYHSLAQKTVKGVMWSSLSFVASKGITFLTTIILARLLSPDNFGLMSMGLLAIGYLDTFGGFGVGTVVIYKQDDVERNSNVAFTFGLIVNSVLGLIAFLVAPWVAAFFREPAVTEIVRALALTIVIWGFGSIHEARLEKDLKFRKSFIPDIGKTTAKGVVSIGLALLGFGVWSLVWGQIAAVVTATILLWIVNRWRPRLSLDLNVIRNLLGYSTHIILVLMMGVFQNNLDYLIIGRRYDAQELGFYTMAYRVPEMLVIYACSIFSRALFPAFSKIQNDADALRKAFLNTERYIALYTVPVGIGLALVTSAFVKTAYGSQWLPAISIMQVLCVYVVIYSFSYTAGDIYKAIGRPDILTKTSIADISVAIPMLWIGANYGVLYVAMAHLLSNIILTIVKLIVVKHLIQLRYRDIWHALQPAITAGLVMGVIVFATQLQLQALAPILTLVILALVGAFSYAAALWIMNRSVAVTGFDLVKNIVSERLNPGQA